MERFPLGGLVVGLPRKEKRWIHHEGGRKMKKYLIAVLLVVFFFTPGILLAQAKEEEKPKEPPTKLEAFLAKKGKLIVKDEYNVGTLKKLGTVEFSAIVLYEPGMESQRIKGMFVKIKESGSVERKRTSFLDLEEIESMSKAITYMADLAEKWKGQTREAYTDVTFSAKGDFQIGFYHAGTKRSVFMYAGYALQTSAFMGVEDFPEIKAILDRGLSLLKQK